MRLTAAALMCCAMVFAAQGCSDSQQPHVTGTTPYTITVNGSLPPPVIPSDNPLTQEGVLLGRTLFHDPLLSKNSKQSCADCHRQESSFIDPNRAFSIGVDGLPGKRNAMPLFNLAYPATYFWDGRAATLRQQVLMPIQDPIEMHESLGNVTAKLRASSTYPALFKRAFGSEEITPQTMALALEQFLHTMLSYNSRFDRSRRGELQLTPQEDRGAQLFFTEFNPASSKKGADCFHCHGTSLFTNNEFMNNGLDSAHQFTDMGHFDVTGNPQHKATFKTPSLRNIEVTAPYMHDGRFRTLEEVIEHYNSGVKFSETLATDLKVTRVGLNLTPQDKADLLAFLRTLTDTTFLNDKRFAKP